MTDQRHVDDDVLDLTEEQEIEAAGDTADPDAEQQDDGEDYLSFGGDDADPAQEEPETDLVKRLRREIRERDKKLAQVARQPQAEEPIVVGDRPTMESVDYDQEAFDREFDAWEERREAKRQQDQRLEQGQRQQQERWQQVQTSYQQAKQKLPFADKQEAEQAAFDELTEIQQAVIASVADNPALVIYAVGKNRGKLAEIAGIEDPLKLAKHIGKMEASMTVKKRARPPQPDTAVKGSTISSTATDKHEKKLEEEAERTGDRTKLIQYRRQKRANG